MPEAEVAAPALGETQASEPADQPQTIPPPVEEPEGSEEQVAVEEEFEEIEHNGKKHKIAKELKPALMMQADYTRKTQELAEQRRALEAQVVQQVEVSKETSAKRGRLAHAEDVIAQYQKVDWDRIEADNPEAAQSGWRKYQQWMAYRDNVSKDITTAEAESTQAAQQATVKRAEEAKAIMLRDIPGWGTPDQTGATLAHKVAMYAVQELGYAPEELGNMADARTGKALHQAYVSHQLQKKQNAAQKASAEPPVETQPLATVTARSGAARKSLGDAGMDEYVAIRKAEEARKARH